MAAERLLWTIHQMHVKYHKSENRAIWCEEGFVVKYKLSFVILT